MRCWTSRCCARSSRRATAASRSTGRASRAPLPFFCSFLFLSYTGKFSVSPSLIGCFSCARSKEVLGLILVKDLVLIDEGLRVSDIRMRPLPFLRADTPMYDLLQVRPVVVVLGFRRFTRVCAALPARRQANVSPAAGAPMRHLLCKPLEKRSRVMWILYMQDLYMQDLRTSTYLRPGATHLC